MGNTTNKEIMLQRLQEILGADHVFPEEPMKKHITFRVGGPAEWFVQVDTVEQLQQVIALCKELEEPYYLIGNGSDLLVSDAGVRGVIIHLSGEFLEINAKENVNLGVCDVCAGAGVMLAALSLRAGKKGFTGLEFANGIPGTVGGAVLMNAGAYGGDAEDFIIIDTDSTNENLIANHLVIDDVSDEDTQYNPISYYDLDLVEYDRVAVELEHVYLRTSFYRNPVAVLFK